MSQKKCPVCSGQGKFYNGERARLSGWTGAPAYDQCWRCEGTGEINETSPSEDSEPEPLKETSK